MDEYDHIRDYVKKSVGDEETQILISEFAVLWNQYEDELYGEEHHARSIPKMINRLEILGSDIPQIRILNDKLVDYIKSKNEYNYDGLIRGFSIMIKEPIMDEYGNIARYPNGQPVLKGDISSEDLQRLLDSDDYKDNLYFMLLIVSRVRNRMFHGAKEIYNLKNQKELFRTCNEILKFMIDLNKRRLY